VAVRSTNARKKDLQISRQGQQKGNKGLATASASAELQSSRPASVLAQILWFLFVCVLDQLCKAP